MSELLRIPGNYNIAVNGDKLRIRISIEDNLTSDETKLLIQQLRDSMDVLDKATELTATIARIANRTPPQDKADAQRKIPRSEHPNIIARREAGESYKDIAKNYHVTDGAIYAIVKKLRPDLRISPNSPTQDEGVIHRLPRRKLSPESYADIAMKVTSGERQVDVARQYGVSRERIRQIVLEHDPNAISIGRGTHSAIKREQAAVLAEVRMVQTALKNGPCVVCAGPVTRTTRLDAKNKTCSPRCARLWTQCRLHLNEEYRENHRTAAAKWVIANLDPNDPKRSSSIRHARRVLDGTAQQKGTWTTKDSTVGPALKEVERLRVEIAATGESWWT